MFQQELGQLGMLGQAGYDPHEQARRKQRAMQQAVGPGSLHHAAVVAQRQDYERAERARKAEIEKIEHRRKLLLLED